MAVRGPPPCKVRALCRPVSVQAAGLHELSAGVVFVWWLSVGRAVPMAVQLVVRWLGLVLWLALWMCDRAGPAALCDWCLACRGDPALDHAQDDRRGCRVAWCGSHTRHRRRADLRPRRP